MALYYRPRLAPALQGFPRGVTLAPRADGTWIAPTLRAGPVVVAAAPGETVEVSVALPAGEDLVFAETGEPVVARRFPPSTAGGSFHGPALLQLTLASAQAPRFSHVLITVRARYVGHRDVYLRHRVLVLES